MPNNCKLLCEINCRMFVVLTWNAHYFEVKRQFWIVGLPQQILVLAVMLDVERLLFGLLRLFRECGFLILLLRTPINIEIKLNCANLLAIFEDCLNFSLCLVGEHLINTQRLCLSEQSTILMSPFMGLNYNRSNSLLNRVFTCKVMIKLCWPKTLCLFNFSLVDLVCENKPKEYISIILDIRMD